MTVNAVQRASEGPGAQATRRFRGCRPSTRGQPMTPTPPAVVGSPGAVKRRRPRPPASATLRTPTCPATCCPRRVTGFGTRAGMSIIGAVLVQVGLGQDPGADVLAHRLPAQLLCGPAARQAVGVVKQLLALQAQDFVGVRLSVRARSTGLTAAHVDRARVRACRELAQPRDAAPGAQRGPSVAARADHAAARQQQPNPTSAGRSG